MPNLVPQDIREWMRRMEFRMTDLTRRMSTLIPGDIADGVNLNDYMSTGRWRRPSLVGTTTVLGYPFNAASGTLEVFWEPTSSQVHQIWYDRSGSIWTRWWNGTTWSAWHPSDKAGLPTMASTTVNPTQSITSTTLATLPTPCVATLSVPPGSHLVRGSVSCLIGSTTGFSPTSAVVVKYWLSGATSFQPALTEAGIAGPNVPAGSGGGTLTFEHEVTVSSATNLTIEAMAGLIVGTAGATIRSVRVQLVVERRN